jgi:phosphoketolase
MEMLSEHTVEGWLEGYILSGRHGFINSYEPFIHVIDSMFNQHAKWLEKCNELPWRANVASLNLLITALVWRQDHNGFTHQDPGFLDSRTRAPALCASICRRTLTACFLWLTTASEALTMSTSS